MLLGAFLRAIFGKRSGPRPRTDEEIASDEYWSGLKDGKNPLVKGLINLNQYMNPNHDWFDYSEMQDTIGSAKDKYLGTGLTPAEQEANAFSAQEAQKARDWEEYMSNTSYQRMVTDMQKAGVNPAMALSSGQIGTPSSPSPTSVSPVGGNMSDLMALFSLPYQIKNIKAQTENIQADTSKKQSETTGINLDNSWKDIMNGLEAESKQERNKLTAKEREQIVQNIRESERRCAKLREETNSEVYKQLLYESEECLNRAKAWQIAEMMPYEKALAQAKTDAEKASAAVAFVQAAYQKGLIDAGYIHALTNNLKSETSKTQTEEFGKWLENVVFENKNDAWLNLPETAVGEVSYDLTQALGILRWAITGK